MTVAEGHYTTVIIWRESVRERGRGSGGENPYKTVSWKIIIILIKVKCLPKGLCVCSWQQSRNILLYTIIFLPESVSPVTLKLTCIFYSSYPTFWKPWLCYWSDHSPASNLSPTLGSSRDNVQPIVCLCKDTCLIEHGRGACKDLLGQGRQTWKATNSRN